MSSSAVTNSREKTRTWRQAPPSPIVAGKQGGDVVNHPRTPDYTRDGHGHHVEQKIKTLKPNSQKQSD